MHDNAVNYFVLFDQLEWQTGSGGDASHGTPTAGSARDRDRLWFRTEGEAEDGDWNRRGAPAVRPRHSRAGGTWWPASGRTSRPGRRRRGRRSASRGWRRTGSRWRPRPTSARRAAPQFRFETEYDLLLTNRLVLQPLVELDVYGKADPERRIGAASARVKPGLRLRYEFRRELAPYVGVAWERKFGETADFAEADGEAIRRAATGDGPPVVVLVMARDLATEGTSWASVTGFAAWLGVSSSSTLLGAMPVSALAEALTISVFRPESPPMRRAGRGQLLLPGLRRQRPRRRTRPPTPRSAERRPSRSRCPLNRPCGPLSRRAASGVVPRLDALRGTHRSTSIILNVSILR